jgi:hypothetical protein
MKVYDIITNAYAGEAVAQNYLSDYLCTFFSLHGSEVTDPMREGLSFLICMEVSIM